MMTTVRVSEQTVSLLTELKKETNATSMEEVIINLITYRKKKISLFGVDKNLSKWDEEVDRAKFRD